MTFSIKDTLIGLAIIIIIDSIYLTLNMNMYKPILEKDKDFSVIHAILAWLVIIIAIQLLVLSRNDLENYNDLYYGFVLGIAMYGVYNFSNYAIYPNKWTNTITVIDTLWGGILTAKMSMILLYVHNNVLVDYN